MRAVRKKKAPFPFFRIRSASTVWIILIMRNHSLCRRSANCTELPQTSAPQKRTCWRDEKALCQKRTFDVLLRAHGGTAEVAATASGKQDQSRRETLLLGMREEHGCDANV